MGMVDVGKKKKTRRIARAAAHVGLSKEIIDKINGRSIPKGDVLETARIAGIMAAKKTAELLPLCHNIEIEQVDVDFTVEKDGVRVESVVKTTAKTGVEMEALTAVFAAALTIYDMCKMFSRSIEINHIGLLEKSGGRSGHYKKSEED